jgi:hypothetical protein
MMEPDAALARGEGLAPQHSGGAGAPLGGTMTPREDLADGRRLERSCESKSNSRHG